MTNTTQTTQTIQIIQFDSLKEYRNAAIRLVYAIGPRLNSLVAKQIVSNEDELNNIIETIIDADWKWNGKGSRFGWRKQCVTYAIKRYMTKYKKNKLKISLFGDSEAQLIDIFPASTDSPLQKLINAETSTKLQEALDSQLLNDIQKRCIQLRFTHKQSLRTIAKNVDLSAQMVNNHLHTAFAKLKRVLQ